MEQLCGFFKSFGRIDWTTSTIVICATPLALTFVLLHLSIFVFDEQVGSIVSNDRVCVEIGREMLDEGGSVVDAAIATMLCESVILPNRAGIGGGFTAIMFINGRMDTLTATPIVPENYPTGYLGPNSTYIEGSKAAGVPGELHGYWELHQKYGMLPWKKLFQPTIKLCEEGIPVTEWLELDMQRTTFFMYRSKTMRELYRVLSHEGDGKTFKMKKLAKTLREIAQYGVDVFYKGHIGKDLVDDIRADGGLITENDLRQYKSIWKNEPIMIRLPNDLRAFTTPLPSMGAVVALVLNVVKALPHEGSHVFWHTVIETMKHALGHSFSLSDIDNETNKTFVALVEKTYHHMTDPDFAQIIRHRIISDRTFTQKDYYGAKYRPTVTVGSSNICVMSPKGDSLVMTSSLMWDFKTFFWSRKTGIILNNLIRNFLLASVGDLPPSRSSYVKPGKRAISPSCPVIVLNQPRAQSFFVVGASGSEMIPSQVATAVINYCFLHRNAYYAANSGFFYPEVMSNTIQVFDPISSEADFEEGLMDYLNDTGHVLRTAIKSNPYLIRTCIGHDRVNPDIQFTSHQQGGSAIVEPEPGLNTFLVIILVCISFSILSVMIYEIVKVEINDNQEYADEI